MSQPPHEPPTEPPNEPPSEPPPNPPPPNPGQWIPPDQLAQPGYGAPVPPPPVPPPPPSAGIPPPPSPPKSRAGLIIGLAVAGIVLVAGILAIVLLVGSESDSDDDSEADDETSSSSEPSESEEPPGELIEGDGYSYELPEDWQDISAEVVGGNPGTTLDSASAWGSSVATGRANLIVEVTTAGDLTDLEDARAELAKNLETSLGAPTEPVDNLTIDGEDAAGVTLTRVNDAELEIVQTAYVTLLDGTAYVITTTNESDDDEPQAAYDAIYDSWTWE